jgi:WG containing repeat
VRICAFFVICCCQLSAANAKLFPVRDGERCGFAVASGEVVIPAQFRDCGSFAEGFAPVQVGDRWGYIDETGTTAIAPQFLAADSFSEGLAFVKVSAESSGVIDRQGKILFHADYYEHGKFSEGLAPIYLVHSWACPGGNFEPHETCPTGRGFPLNAQWGYIDRSGAMAISPRFIAAGEFHDGLAYADGGFIDHQGTKVILGPFSNATSFTTGLAAVQVDHKAWGYIDTRGAWLAPPLYDAAGAIEDGRGLVQRGGQYGYVDTSGAPVIAPQFDGALPFSEERAAVRRNGDWGYIDISGNVVIPFQFEAAQSFQDGFASVATESGTVVIDKRGRLVNTQPVTLTQTFRRLQSFEVASDRAGPLHEILPMLSEYKEQLRQLAAQKLNDSDDPAKAKNEIETALSNAGILRSKEQESRPYGLVDNFEIDRSPLQPKLLSVLFHLRFADAIDTSFSLFRRNGSNWDLIFKIDRNDYLKSEFDAYHIAPPQFTASGSKGSFLMLLASDSGRSADGGYQLWVDLYRVDTNFDRSQLFHAVFYCKDHQIALDDGGFRLETISMEYDAARAGYRVFPYRYEIRGDRVIRVAPIGFNVHDFVGEWGNLPWDQAASWSDPAHLARIQEYYNKLRDNGYFGGEFGEVQVCDPQQRIWQIELNSAPAATSTYFLVERNDKWTFIVKDIGVTMRQGCKDVESEPRRPFSTMFSKPLDW